MPKQGAAAKTTTNHDTIRRWVEQRGGCPATVKSTRGKNEPGVIRIDYTGYSGKDTLEPISWREFFKAFEQNQLAFLYQERTASGRQSRFSKLVHRDQRGRSAGKTTNGSSKRRSASGGRKASSSKRTTKRATARSSSQRGAGAKVTTNHDAIRRWVEERGGCPAAVKRTRGDKDPGIIRIDYTGFSGKDSLEKISWREFFDAFEQNNLAFLYQDRTASGRPSRFSKLIDRNSAQAKRQSARSTKQSVVRRGKSSVRRKASPGRSRARRASSRSSSR